MVFTSPLFLFLFLPIVLTLYFVVPQRFKNAYLLLASLIFYIKGEKSYVFILIFFILVNYVFALLIGSKEVKKNNILKTVLLVFGIQFNLALLIFYKYAQFLLQYLNPVLNFINSGSIQVENIFLIVGISFYTFHSISYLVDVYRGMKPQKNIINIALYISFFPQLIAGPIVRYHTIAKDIIKRTVSSQDIAIGIERFIVGLSKKVLLADKIAPVVNTIFSSSPLRLDISTAWLGIACYGLQIYFDFSGYSDMAIGLARMVGFHFPENFNYPYISQSITDFWRRWHMSLSSWFRDYVYIPLGGNRKGKERTYINLLFVFLLVGIWHGASWTFIVWGVWFGLFLVLEKWKLLKLLNSMWWPVKHVYALFVVLLGWVFFRSPTISYSWEYFKTLFFVNHTGFVLHTVTVANDTLIAIFAAFLLSMPIKNFMEKTVQTMLKKTHNKQRFFLHSFFQITYIVVLIVLILYSSIQIAETSYHPFLYFQF